MKYQNAQLRQMLAAEYALGTLHGRARARFRRLLKADRDLQATVHLWEQRLASLGGRGRPVAPRELVWAGIDRAINASSTVALPVRRARVDLWRVWATVSTAASMLLSFALWQQMQQGALVVEVPKLITVQRPAAPMPYVAMLQPQKSEMKWKVSLYPERGLMKVAASGHYDMDATRQSLELWVVESGGPRSLGVLPSTGEAEMPLPKNMPMQGDLTLAVSLEPHGGSPTGSPTGPVILAAPAIRAL